MKKKSIIILSATITILIISSFGITNKKSDLQITDSHSDSTKVEFSDFGINGGINIDVRTGKKIEFLASNKKSELNYMVRGYSNRGFHKQITRQQLSQATSIKDIIENYPDNWISAYNSVVISGIGNHENTKAIGSNYIITEKQKELINSASEIHITVHYQKKNENNEIHNRQMNTSFIVIPEIQAQFEGGIDNLISYLKEKSLNGIKAKNLILPQPTIYFTVNKKGNIENTEIAQTSGDSDIDKMLVNILKEMPQWIPAKNTKGENVEQKFALDIGMDGC